MPPPFKQQHDGYLRSYKVLYSLVSYHACNELISNNKLLQSSVGGKFVGKAARQVVGEHKKGYTFPIEIKLSKIDTPQGVTFAGIIHEVSEDESEARITIDPLGIILAGNKRLLKMFGYNHAELVGKNIKILMPAKYANHHDEYLQVGATVIITRHPV